MWISHKDDKQALLLHTGAKQTTDTGKTFISSSISEFFSRPRTFLGTASYKCYLLLLLLNCLPYRCYYCISWHAIILSDVFHPYLDLRGLGYWRLERERMLWTAQLDSLTRESLFRRSRCLLPTGQSQERPSLNPTAGEKSSLVPASARH